MGSRAARQVIDDVKRVTLVGLGSVSESVKKALESDKRSATKNKARDGRAARCCSWLRGGGRASVAPRSDVVRDAADAQAAPRRHRTPRLLWGA